MTSPSHDRRKTEQLLMPVRKEPVQQGEYDIYPSHDIGENKIFQGYRSLAERIATEKIIIIDGYAGVFFDDIREGLDGELRKLGISANWVKMEAALKSDDEIDVLIRTYLGGNDPLFGTRMTRILADFYDRDKVAMIAPDPSCKINIVYGVGAALVGWQGLFIYVDLPKNELQYRARAGSITNLGAIKPTDIKSMYKRFYFVDWVVLNRHKKSIIKNIDIMIDGQREEELTWMAGEDFRDALRQMSLSAFRVRPWFEPGPWGGQWIKHHIGGLNKDVTNYAWSFELIVPENGIILESSQLMLEISFDFLMYFDNQAILGKHAEKYGTEFPIRFDFLDTFEGGNLSIQVHPLQPYISGHFGENFTQEETYYILDSKEDAKCHLGFREDIDPESFKTALEKSYIENKPLDISQFVETFRSKKHDLFLIPPGTIHGSGKNNLVLEISTTPYIFTFKMYDWLRPDLEGKPRPLNISRAMDNLCFDRKGDKVEKKLISRPELKAKGEDWELYSLPTHEEHSYSIERYHFRTRINTKTDGLCHVLNLVEGTSIIVETANGVRKRFNYAETFVISAAAESYSVINQSDFPAMLVRAFLK